MLICFSTAPSLSRSPPPCSPEQQPPTPFRLLPLLPRPMEFARRGPAADEDVDGGRRFADPPPPHGDTMVVIRDALLLQLRMDRLRQQIIVAELAKIERTMALRSASHLEIATAPVEGDKVVPFTVSEQFMPYGRWPVNAGYYAHMDEVHDLKKDECHGGVDLKSMRPTMEDRMGECLRPCCNAKVGRENGAADERKLQERNKAAHPKRTLPSAQWELTGITIPVKKPKSLLKWNCAICQVQTPSERHLQEHWGGKKHRSIVATLESINNSQKVVTTAEHSSCADQKTSPIKWSCSTCQANGTSEADLKELLNETIHQQKIDEGQRMEGDGMAKNVEPPEAVCHKSNVQQYAENPPAVWSCSSCRANCTSESDLGSHLLVKIQALLNEINSMARNSESREAKLPPNIVPHHAEQTSQSSCSICQANCDSQSDLENHLGSNIHQLNVQALEEAKQTENIPPQITKNQGPPSESDSSICQAKCNSEPQSEHQSISRKRQKKIEALQREGKDAESGGLNPADKLPSDGCDNKSERSEEEKQTTLDFCKVCNLRFNSKNMLADHFRGEEHLEKQKHQENSGPRQGEKPHGKDSVHQPGEKVRPEPVAVWRRTCSLCQAKCTSAGDYHNHLVSRRHQENTEALRADPRKTAAEWKIAYYCALCDAQCNGEKMMASHLVGRRHREMVEDRE